LSVDPTSFHQPYPLPPLKPMLLSPRPYTHMRLSTLLCLLLAALSIIAAAMDITVLGAGNMSCGRWIQERNMAQHFDGAAWVQGYIRGAFNYTRLSDNTDPLDGIEAATINEWLDRYCQKNRGAMLFQAADTLTRELMGRAHFRNAK